MHETRRYQTQKLRVVFNVSILQEWLAMQYKTRFQKCDPRNTSNNLSTVFKKKAQ